MGMFSVYQYINTKQLLISEMQLKSLNTSNSLQKNLSHFIESYAVNEYEILLENEMYHKDIVVRSKEALKWQEEKRREVNYKHHQAEHMRKTTNKYEKKERKDAGRMAKSMIQKHNREQKR